MKREAKSILEWTEEDFRKAGMLTRSALAGASHPFLDPCEGIPEKRYGRYVRSDKDPHKWDLDQENGKLYIYCTKCQTTHKLEKDRAIVQDPKTRWGS